MIADLDELIAGAVTEVFSTMLGMNMTRAPIETDQANGETHIAGAVGFVGRVSGVAYIFTGLSFARRITEAEIEGDEMVNDAMGEMANMLVGHIKSRITDRGMPCVLTIPSVVRGSHFSVEPTTSSEGHVYCFAAGTNRIFIQFLLKPGESSHS
jgi:chemotaxis protein CheX